MFLFYEISVFINDVFIKLFIDHKTSHKSFVFGWNPIISVSPIVVSQMYDKVGYVYSKNGRLNLKLVARLI